MQLDELAPQSPYAMPQAAKPKPYKVTTDASELAMRLQRQIQAVVSAQSQVRNRWDKQEGIYFNDPNQVRQSVVEGTISYPFSIWRIKCDKIVSETVAAMMSTDPLIQFISESDGDEQECEALSRVVQSLLRSAGLDRAFPRACTSGANTNLGAMRLVPIPDPDNEGVRIECQSFDPRHFMVYPVSSQSLEEAVTVGHRFYERLGDIQQKVKDGYYDFGVETGGDDPYEYTRTGGQREIFQNIELYADKVDEPVECFQLIYRTPDGGREMCIYAVNENTVLKIEPYPYSMPWYTYVRYVDNEYTIYTNDSLAYSVQGYCVAHCDLMNAILSGAYLSAWPIMALFGSATNLTAQKAFKGMPGEFHSIPNPDGRIEAVRIPFEPGPMFTMAQMLESLIDQTLGVSALGTSGSVDPQTKATAINIQANADARKMAGYLRAAANAIRDLGRIAHEFVKLHHPQLMKTYGEAMAMKEPGERMHEYRIEVTGQSGDAMPDVMLQKMQLAKELALRPGSEYDPNKIDNVIMQSLHLPSNPDALKKDYVSPVMDMAGELETNGIDPVQVMQLGMATFQNEIDANEQSGLADPNGVPQEAGMDPASSGMGEPTPDALGGANPGEGLG